MNFVQKNSEFDEERDYALETFLYQKFSDINIDDKFFDEYFKDSELAYALRIDDLKIYDTPIEPCKIIPNFKAPQSFRYIRETVFHEGDGS